LKKKSCLKKKKFNFLLAIFKKKERNGPLPPPPNEKFCFFWPHISFACQEHFVYKIYKPVANTDNPFRNKFEEKLSRKQT
jgi:hypothetical protein